MSLLRLTIMALLLLPVVAGSSDSQGEPPPHPGALQRQIDELDPGATFHLKAGRYTGPIRIERSLTLVGEEGTTIDAAGFGSVITVNAPNVTLRGLTLVGSGISLAEEHSGVFVTQAGDGVVIEENRIQGNLFGVFLKGPEHAVVRKNHIEGRLDLRRNERGNGVHLWNSPGSVVEQNTIRYGRDGIFVTTSRQNRFHGNRFDGLRYAIHYMYTNDSEVSKNYSFDNNSGFALMFSDRLRVLDNVSNQDRERGLFLNFANASEITGNRVLGGAQLCVFLYNANRNRFQDNRFEGCDIGIHFTAGSEGNEIVGNAFVGNRTQVKYVGTRHLEWSRNGRGNYWSDNFSFDLDGDGIGDRVYRPNNLTDKILWRYPQARMLLNSPALQLLNWAQSQFPGLHPGGVIDSAPLMLDPQRVAQQPIPSLSSVSFRRPNSRD